ncbi:unnamed protein product [Durusdinium trenchii]|uniref:3'-5' exonuclease domain-containing protein n=1 Tax=Durusdinium trenchii TaxID=1381693 RepID=A0ABP0RRU9_9DINO
MPPPNKKAVIYERLVPADSLEKSTGTLTERIHCFDVAQPEVEEILEHFGPFPDVPRLVEVNAMSSSDETFEAVEEKVALLLQRKRAEIAQAEEAARAAQATEEEAAAPVEPETADADHADAAAAAADAAPADAAADADAAENTDPPPEPPFQAVQLSELPSYVGKIEDEVFNLLMEEWSELQGDLVSSLQQLFNWHRSHLADFKSGLFGMKQRFSEFVQRSDGKQDMVDDFVERFNLFTEEYPEMRKQEPTKAELHLRAEELHQRLKAEVEKQSSENLEQLEVMQTSRWLESQTEVLASQEWKPSFQKGQPPSRSAVLSICAGPWILAVDLLPWRKQTCEPLCEGLWSFLENEQNTFYGMGLVGDLARLAFEFDCVCDGVDFNLRGWSSLQPLSGGLTGLANRVLGTSVEQSKAVTRSNWNLRPLSEIQMLYIAEDAYMSWKIAMTLLQTECKVQEDWFVTMAEMYGSGKEFWQHGLTVPESCHDWSMAQHEWQLKQEAKKQKLRDKEIERRKKAETRKRALEADTWTDRPSASEKAVRQVQHAVQLEVKRYHACCQLLSDFYYSALCLGLPEEHEAPPKVDIFAPPEPEEVPDPKKKKDDKKKKPGDAPEEPEISPEEKAAARLCKYIPDEESGGEGRWEFPFLAELMEQASKAVWKLEDFTPPSIEVPEEEEKEDPKAKAKAKGKAKAKEKPKKEEEDMDRRSRWLERAVISIAVPPMDLSPFYPRQRSPPPQPAPALFVDLQQALLAERVTFRQRLQMIQGWAIRRLHQAASSTKSTFRDLNDWILLRRHKDLEAVASLVDVLKEQVESEDFIKTKLCLKNAHLHQRPNTLLRAPKPEKVPPEVEGVAPFRWTMEQLDLLFEVVASAAAAISPSCRVLPNYTLLRILEQLTSADGGDKRTVKVPANWRNCGEAKLKQMLAAFDHPYSGSCIDLVDFLFHMLLLHSPVGWPSLNTLMEVRRVLEAQAPRGAIWPDFYVPGHVVESLPLFEESGEESFAKKFKPITTLAPNMFDRPGAQLKWVAKVLQRYRAPSGEHEAWSVEVAWYDYRVQRHEDSERLVEMLDDVRSTPTDTPRQPGAEASMWGSDERLKRLQVEVMGGQRKPDPIRAVSKRQNKKNS